MDDLHFFVSGVPIAKARARVVASKVRGGKARAFTPAKTEAWEARVRWVARVESAKLRWVPLVGPCMIEIALRGLNPRADVDNAAKSILDALNGIAWDDDRRVVDLHVYRAEWLARDGALVTIASVDEAEAGGPAS